MSKLEHEGTFKGVPRACKIVEKDGGVQWVATLHATEAWNPETKAWQDHSGHSIDTYQTLVSKAGAVNEVTVNQLKAALGWDGVTLEHLCGDFDEPVKFGTKNETWQGKTTLKVKWMDHHEAEGKTLKPVDPAALKSLQARFGTKLKALAAVKK